MRIKVIACEVLFREVCLCAARSPHVIDLEFLRRGLHDNPETLRAEVQQAIDATDARGGAIHRAHSPRWIGVPHVKYDAIALGYGLCSNGTLGLVARDTPLVIPRAHDCITFFLGSKDAYHRHFHDEPGTYYYTSGWVERAGGGVPRTREEGEGLQIPYEELVAKYGEDNAQYLYEISQSWIKNYARAAFIGLGLGEALRAEALRVAQERSWDFTDLPGDLRLLCKLLDGEWDEAEFLVVPPGHRVTRGDEASILATEDADESKPPMYAD